MGDWVGSEMKDAESNVTDIPLQTSDEPCKQSPAKMGEWLVSEMKDAESKAEHISIQILKNPRIHKVPRRLLQIHGDADLFEPQVVSIGPYHYDKPRLMLMQDFKKAATKWFIDKASLGLESFYAKVQEVAQEAKECYAELPEKLCHDEFVNMMFFDGCFLLCLIDHFTRDKMEFLPVSKHLQGSIMKDIFMLENQLPYVVLTALMSLKHVDIPRFFEVYLGTIDNIALPKDPQIHLLGLLRSILVGSPTLTPPPVRAKYWKTSRSASELVQVGVEINSGETNNLSDISFVGSYIRGQLLLPMIIVNDWILSRFLNLIAFEMSPHSNSDYRISSYVWFMDQLIQHKEDVKELRANGILLNELGNDQQVADLFHKMALEIEPDRQVFYGVMRGVDVHCSNKIRVSIVRPVMVHFSQWGTNPIAFAAATVLLILTVVQTIYAVKPSGGR